MFKDIAPPPAAGVIAKARKQRRKMTLPEALLWRELRGKPGGLKFRRQHPAGKLVLDFCCTDARLAVEIDGIAHDMGDRPARDAARDAWLAQAGIETLRVPAADVLRDVGKAAEAIVEYARARLPAGHPAQKDR